MGCGSARAVDASTPSGKPQVVFVLGGPGSGKGTQWERIVKNFGYTHLSTGDLLREEVKKGGELADKLNAVMSQGKLVSSDLLVQLLKKAMKGKKFLIDGFPRNQENIDEWNKQIGDTVDLQFVLMMDVSEDVMRERLLKRGQESGRADDNEATILKRFETFQKESLPVIKNYEKLGKVKKINSGQAVDAVFEDVKKAFKK